MQEENATILPINTSQSRQHNAANSCFPHANPTLTTWKHRTISAHLEVEHFENITSRQMQARSPVLHSTFPLLQSIDLERMLPPNKIVCIINPTMHLVEMQPQEIVSTSTTQFCTVKDYQ